MTTRRTAQAKAIIPTPPIGPVVSPMMQYATEKTRQEITSRNWIARLFNIPARVDSVTYRASALADKPIKIEILDERGGDLRPVFTQIEPGYTHIAMCALVEIERHRVNY